MEHRTFRRQVMAAVMILGTIAWSRQTFADKPSAHHGGGMGNFR